MYVGEADRELIPARLTIIQDDEQILILKLYTPLRIRNAVQS
jgi:hypothetical protein